MERTLRKDFLGFKTKKTRSSLRPLYLSVSALKES